MAGDGRVAVFGRFCVLRGVLNTHTREAARTNACASHRPSDTAQHTTTTTTECVCVQLVQNRGFMYTFGAYVRHAILHINDISLVPLFE